MDRIKTVKKQQKINLELSKEIELEQKLLKTYEKLKKV